MVALIVIVISIIPVYFAHRLTQDEGGAGARGGAAGDHDRARGDRGSLGSAGSGSEVDAGRGARPGDEHRLPGGGVDLGMAEHHLEPEPVLERHEPARDRRGSESSLNAPASTPRSSTRS